MGARTHEVVGLLDKILEGRLKGEKGDEFVLQGRTPGMVSEKITDRERQVRWAEGSSL
jgi:hypothetical protein